MTRPILNLGLDADASFVPFLAEIGEKFAALGYPKPLLLCYTKIITPDELAAYQEAGFPVALIFEVGAENSLGGAAQGDTDGKRCVAQMQALGAPQGCAVYLTSDTDVASVSDLAATADYWSSADASISKAGYRIGAYADGTELMNLHTHGLDFEWLAGATGWDGSKAMIGTGTPDMVQGIVKPGASWMGIDWPTIEGLNYDPDVVYSVDVGQIMPSDSAPAPASTAASTSAAITDLPATATPEEVVDLVKTIQQKLTAMGMYRGPIDGRIDPGGATQQGAWLAWHQATTPK